MEKGIVKWFNNAMKYGFILSEEGKEIFVHFSEIQIEGYKTLKRGDVVEYELEQTPKGVKAVKVVKLGTEKFVKPEKKNGNFRKSA